MVKLDKILKRTLLAAGIGAGLLSAAGCEKTVTEVIIEQHWNNYRDIYGNIEYESRFDQNSNTDDYYDDGILARLYFAGPNNGFQEGDLYGYYLTADTEPVNYWFKFIPEGEYYLRADLDVVNERNPALIDSYSALSNDFYQFKDQDRVINMDLHYIGSSQASSAVSLSKRIEPGKLYLAKPVYDRLVKDIAATGKLEDFLKVAIPITDTKNIDGKMNLAPRLGHQMRNK